MRGLRFVLAALPLVLLIGCGEKQSGPKVDGAVSGGLSKLDITTVTPGTGKEVAEAGDTVYVFYTGKLKNGTEFDSNIGKKPYPVTLGGGSVIKGWEDGLLGIKAGERRKLGIPYQLAYGEEDKGKIPPKSDLYFDIECTRIMKKGDVESIVQRVIIPGTGKEVVEGSTVTIHFRILSVTGEVIEDSRSKDTGFGAKTFKVGDKKAVIPGVNAGMIGMKKGGKYMLTIPPRFGIQKQDPSFEMGSPADFEIDVIDVK